MMSCKAPWFTLPMWTSWPHRWLLLVHRHPSQDHQSFVEVFNDLRGGASTWQKTWLADWFRFIISLRFHEILTEATEVPAQSQARSLFQGVPHVALSQYVIMPWDVMSHITARRNTKGLLDGSTKSLGEAVFALKFPALQSIESAFLMPQSIDMEAVKHFPVWVKKDFSLKKPIAADTTLCLAMGERLSVRLMNVWHVWIISAACSSRSRPKSCTQQPNRLSCCSASVRMHQPLYPCSMRTSHRPRFWTQCIFNGGDSLLYQKRFFELPLDSKKMFAGRFDEILKETTSTEAVAMQSSANSGWITTTWLVRDPQEASPIQGPRSPMKKAKKSRSPARCSSNSSSMSRPSLSKFRLRRRNLWVPGSAIRALDSL